MLIHSASFSGSLRGFRSVLVWGWGFFAVVGGGGGDKVVVAFESSGLESGAEEDMDRG